MTFRLLDLFCGAGGAGMGYRRAGFEVVGVDILPQKHYPFEFHQADALEFLAEYGSGFDVIHASPPCQGYSKMRFLPWLAGLDYPLLIEPLRKLLEVIRKPYIIENVSTAPLNGAELCGATVGLPLIRHRRFECHPLILFPSCPGHPVMFPGSGNMAKCGRKEGVMGVLPGYSAQQATGIDWMTGRELRQAIPPAYTEYIGGQMMTLLTKDFQEATR